MSANNWMMCPDCGRRADEEYQSMLNDIDEDYGKVPIEEYNERMRNIKKRDLKETLREDWEIGLDDSGVFRATYCCHCDECGFHYEFDSEEVHVFSHTTPNQ